MIGRALLAIAIVGATLHHAGAQFGAPPAQCRELLTLRDELQKHGEAIEAANQKRADMTVACRLFRTYVATEARLLRGLDTHGASCGVPAQIAPQIRASHVKATQIANQVCAARRPPYRYEAPPIMDDRLIPLMPIPPA